MHFCSIESKEVNELSIGSAANHENLILIECNEPWSSKPIRDSSLPDVVKSYLADYVSKKGNKALLIKSEDRRAQITVFFVKTTPDYCRQYRFSIKSYLDILEIDISDPKPEFVDNTPQIFVCTNGKKDKCCSKFGFPAYKNLVINNNDLGIGIWQCTHFGGDRFAPTLLLTPYGYYYSRVDVIYPSEFLVKIKNKIIALDNLRGKCTYNSFAQAGEFYIRKSYNILEFEGLKFRSQSILDADSQTVSFFCEDGNIYEAIITRSFAPYKNHLTCSHAEKQAPYIYKKLTINNI
jgi:hypothetical protein